MVWEHPDLPGHFIESSCNLEDWPICHECMVEHCVGTNCMGCGYGKYPDCRFLDMKRHYMSEEVTQMIITDKLVEQILAIRASGAVNMFDANGVQIEANKRNFFELVILIEENRKAYSNFILSGDRGQL